MKRAVVLAVCIFATAGLAARWHYLSGGKLSGISSVGSHVWTVGQDGLFFYSEDNGTTWRRIPRFTTRNLVDVEFWDQGFGLVTAEGDVIYRTADNGGTWDSSYVQYIGGHIRFITRDCIWVTSHGAGRILRSTDGGLSWPLSEPSWYASWFLDSLNGWANEYGGAGVMRTTDAGGSWFKVGEVPIPYRNSVICCFGFINEDIGICAWTSSEIVGHWPVTAYGWSATGDGGAGWGCFADADAPGVICDVVPGGRVYGIDTHGTVVWGPLVNTRSGASTFREFRDVSAARGDRAWLCGDGGAVWSSSDSGVSWVAERPQSGVSLRNVDFSDSLHGWGASSDWAARTTDGGRSWIQAATSTGISPITNVVAIDETTCIMAAGWSYFDPDYMEWVGAFGLERTTSAGVAWDTIHFIRFLGGAGPIGSSRFAHVGRHVWHPGLRIPGGNSVRSTDDGATWLDMDTLGSVGEREPPDISFVDTLNGWAIDSRSNIRRTTDAGDSWVIVAETLKAMRLEMLTLLHGCALSDSALFRTTDGGHTWNSAQTGAGLRALHFCDSLYGAAVGDAGLLLRTNDGGETWVRDSSEFTSDLYTVFMLDSTRGWAAGENGLVLGFGDWAVGADEAESPRLRGPGCEALAVGPNPCHGRLVLESGATARDERRFYLLDVAGRKVVELHPGANDVRALAPGVYFIREGRGAGEAGQGQVRKVVITR